MRQPSDDEIARFLCCGIRCEVGPNTGLCHRHDFVTEVAKMRALLNEIRSEHNAKQVQAAAAAEIGAG